MTDPLEQLELIERSATMQVDLNRRVLENNLDASDRIHARRASEKLVEAAVAIASDPTSSAP